MQLIDGWRHWWRRWTTWLAGLAGIITATFTASPALLLGLIAYIPDDMRGVAAGVVGALVFAVPVIVAQVKQSKLADKIAGGKHGTE